MPFNKTFYQSISDGSSALIGAGSAGALANVFVKIYFHDISSNDWIALTATESVNIVAAINNRRAGNTTTGQALGSIMVSVSCISGAVIGLVLPAGSSAPAIPFTVALAGNTAANLRSAGDRCDECLAHKPDGATATQTTHSWANFVIALCMAVGPGAGLLGGWKQALLIAAGGAVASGISKLVGSEGVRGAVSWLSHKTCGLFCRRNGSAKLSETTPTLQNDSERGSVSYGSYTPTATPKN